MKELVTRLAHEHRLDAESYHQLIVSSCKDESTFNYLRNEAVKATIRRFEHGIFVRGLIEISSYCHNDCLYCGLRHSNRDAKRYRLSDTEISECCANGYKIGLRTFVLQGGEDSTFTDDILIPLISKIHSNWNDVAITLSLGERSKESYRALFNAGATRYLLRHEAADSDLYAKLHPSWMSQRNRINCIENLIATGYQTGMGMIVGVPGQTVDALVADLLLMEQFNPHMIGIGPFIPHHQTPLGNHPAGDLNLTLTMIAITRLMFPDALIPATTALSTLSPNGRKAGILSGANVVMPNLSPISVRKKYSIYDNKLSSKEEAAESINLLEQELNSIGYHIDYSKGDFKSTKQ